jgi:pimeloyl-ACP methyl ester carboxylesterase
MPVARLLSDRYTCYSMDRRGRNRSGHEAGPYALEREYEDVLAVLSVAGPGAHLAGHSFGAICALGAALRQPPPRLILYEPPLPVGGPVAGEHLPDYARAIADSNPDLALEIGFRYFTRLHEPEIATLRRTRAWPRLRTLAWTWTRELEAMDAQPRDCERFRLIGCPTLMTLGTESPEHPMQNATRAMLEVLPKVRLEPLPGQDHMAARNAPQMLAGLIADFLSAAGN